MRSPVMLALCTILMAACSAAPAARVLVTFDFDPAATTARSAESFELVVLDRDGAVASDMRYRLVAGPPGPGEIGLPFDLTLEPRDGDTATTYGLEGRLFGAGGTAVATQRARGGYVEGEALELRLVFDDACAGAICAENETCQNGDCFEPCVIPTPIGALGARRSPPVSCPDTPPCPDGEPRTCVPHGPGLGVHFCVEGVHVITHCAGGCDAGACT